MRCGRLILLVGVAFGNLGADGPGPAPKKTVAEIPPLNAKIVAYCKSQLGKKVRNGECTSLASEALKEAGARRFPGGGDGDYVWGRPIDSFRDALPGDVLQFRDAVFKGKRALSKYRTLSWVENYPHHTAILSEVKERGKFVKILHQNYGPDGTSEAEKMVVQEATLHPDALQPGGKVWIYRPVAPDQPSTDSPRQGFDRNQEHQESTAALPSLTDKEEPARVLERPQRDRVHYIHDCVCVHRALCSRAAQVAGKGPVPHDHE